MSRTEPRVLIDATAVPADRGGVGRYVDSLVAALDTDGARVTVACQAQDGEMYSKIAPRSRVVPVAAVVANRAARLTWEQTTLPGLANKLAADVVHSPHYTMPLASRAATVVTLHDATFFTDAVLHSAFKARFFRHWTRLAARRATRCIVPSAATAGELGALVRVHEPKLDVIHHGVDAQRFCAPTHADVRAAREMIGCHSGGYIAFLGTLEPRKNVSNLVRAFVQAAEPRNDQPALVLAGQQGWDSELSEALAAVPRELRVIRAGYLPFENLAGFLGGADVVAYPSHGEGFGLPVLEAMACRACVLTTRNLALPEVGGQAVAYCGAGPGDIAAELTGLLDDPGRRALLAAAAKHRAEEFSWAASAQRHRETYDRAWRET